jgi:hypothetical protein
MPANGKIVLIIGVLCGLGRANHGSIPVIHREPRFVGAVLAAASRARTRL